MCCVVLKRLELLEDLKRIAVLLPFYSVKFEYFIFFSQIAAITVSLTFNIDTKNPDVRNGEKKDFFGYKVLQSADKR